MSKKRHPETSPIIRSTTVLSVRRPREDGSVGVAIAGDGQVTMADVVAKADAVKVRKLGGPGASGGGGVALGASGGGVLVGFAGAAADAFALLERFEATLKETPTNVKKAAVELAKQWRTDRALRRLESLLVVADLEVSLLVSGTGDVIEPSDGVIGIGSGGSYATAAARALMAHTDQTATEVSRHALLIAGELCIYSNTNLTVLDLMEPA